MQHWDEDEEEAEGGDKDGDQNSFVIMNSVVKKIVLQAIEEANQ